MDNWLRLEDPAQVKAYAALVKRLTDIAGSSLSSGVRTRWRC